MREGRRSEGRRREGRRSEGEGGRGGVRGEGGREKEKLKPMQSYIVGREYERRRWRLMEPVWPSCHEQLPAETGQQKNIKMFL